MGHYLRYRGDAAGTAYARFFDPRMAVLPARIAIALGHGPQADQVMLGFDDAATLLAAGYQQTENG